MSVLKLFSLKHPAALLPGLALCLLAVLPACNNPKALLPNVSGKAGEILVVIDKDGWEGKLGDSVRQVLTSDCPYLAQKEPLFSLSNVTPGGFADLFKVHRNILIFNINPSVGQNGMILRNDAWARPQTVIQIDAADIEAARSVFAEKGELIAGSFEQAERDRNMANAKLYEDTGLAKAVRQLAGGSPHFPSGYKLKLATDEFIWIADEKQYTIQGVFVYKYPAQLGDNFELEQLVARRNEMLKAHVPGMLDGSWMTTSEFIRPTVEFIKFRGRQFAQMRGFWEVENDFMGGPFVSHSFFSPDAQKIIVVEAWVYAPKYDKRQYLRQVESIIYSFEWDK